MDADWAAFGLDILGLAADVVFLAAVLALAVVFFAADLAVDVVFFAAAVVRDFVDLADLADLAAELGLRAVVLVLRPDEAGLAAPAVGGLMAEMVLAALVSASAALASALVAVFIVFIAVFIACAEVVALLAASVILVAADDTFVAADDTRVAAAAGVTDDLPAVVDRVELAADLVVDLAGFDAVLRAVPLVFFLAVAVFFAPPVFARLVLAVVRRAVERVNVLVGTDPSPRVDQLRVDLFHN